MSDEPIDPKLHELLTELEKYWNHLLSTRNDLSIEVSEMEASDSDPLKIMETMLSKVLIDLFKVVQETGFMFEIYEEDNKEDNKEDKEISLSQLLDNANIQLLDDWADPNKYKGKDDNGK